MVASSYSMMISCLAMLSQIFTNKHLPRLDYRPSCRNLSDDQKTSVKLTFLHCKIHTNSLITGEQLSVRLYTASLPLLSVCHISISFALLSVLSPPCVLSRKEPAMVKPREGSNFSSSALFLSISVVLYVCPESPTGKKKRVSSDGLNSTKHTYTHCLIFRYFSLKVETQK